MRFLITAAALLALAGCGGAPQGNAPQALVDRAALAVQDVLAERHDRLGAQALLARSRAALVCPQLFRAGLFFAGQGGACVLLARDAAGSWSSPAFYSLGSGSVGLQAGIQDAQLLLLVMNDRALNALLDSQVKLGADASVAFAQFGGRAEAATTTAVGADILAFARARGLFAGVALEGSLLSAKSEWNEAYYGRQVDPRSLVVGMAAHNPGSDPLRAALLQGGAPASVAAAPGIQAVAAAPTGGVDRRALPALR